MTKPQGVADVLDETIKALAHLDLNRLEYLERQIDCMERANLTLDEIQKNCILAKQRVLEAVLHHSALNLNALHRLYGRDTRDPWPH